MRILHRANIGLAFAVVLCLDLPVLQDGGLITSASAQTENGTVTGRVKRWTRASLEAAKKHWAEDQKRFSECTIDLEDMKKKSAKRMSYHRQGEFLEKCMQAKH